MSRVTRALAAVAVGGLAVLTTPAHATPVGPVCRQAALNGSNVVIVCVAADLGESGTTVAPTIVVGCRITNGSFCYRAVPNPLVQLGTTGFVPNVAYPLPVVDPATGSVHVFAGTIGTLYVNGTAVPLATVDFCVGDPSFC
jgi:hypothetical protein